MDTLREESIFLNTLLRKMRWGRKEAHAQKDAPREESYFLNTLLKKDALREDKGPRPKRHSEGGKHLFKYMSQKGCVEGGKRPTSKKETLRKESIF